MVWIDYYELVLNKEFGYSQATFRSLSAYDYARWLGLSQHSKEITTSTLAWTIYLIDSWLAVKKDGRILYVLPFQYCCQVSGSLLMNRNWLLWKTKKLKNIISTKRSLSPFSKTWYYLQFNWYPNNLYFWHFCSSLMFGCCLNIINTF